MLTTSSINNNKPNPMPYLRIACNRELAQIKKDGRLPKNYEPWPPYPVGTVTCLLQHPVSEQNLAAYIKSVAEQRWLSPGNPVHLLLVDGINTNLIVQDASAHCWPESVAYCGDIPLNNVRLAGGVLLGGTSTDYLIIPPVSWLPQPTPL